MKTNINKKALIEQVVEEAFEIHMIRIKSIGDGVTTNGKRNKMGDQITELSQIYKSLVRLINIEDGINMRSHFYTTLIEPKLKEESHFLGFFNI